MSGFDGVIFDLDGTLWDSVETVTASWNQALIRLGAKPRFVPHDIVCIMGKTTPEIAALYFSDFGADALRVAGECIQEENAYIAEHGGFLYPGVEQMLRTLSAEMPLFIVSNCDHGYIEAFLSYFQLEKYFTATICNGDSPIGKAANIARVLREHSLSRPVYIGDTQWDEEAANAAACPFIHAAYGFGTARAPLSVLSAPEKLPALLEECS